MKYFSTVLPPQKKRSKGGNIHSRFSGTQIWINCTEKVKSHIQSSSTTKWSNMKERKHAVTECGLYQYHDGVATVRKEGGEKGTTQI